MFILKYKKIFLGFAALVMLTSIVLLASYKLNFGIEYTGGSVLEFNVDSSLEESEIKARLDTDFGESYSLRASEDSYIVRTRTLTESEKDSLVSVISGGAPETVEIERFNTIGPTLGNELKGKAIMALLLVVVSITLFIAYAFRHVSEPVSSWKYGLITMISLLFDILLTLGAFALLGHMIGIEVDSMFLTALLVILGYSINDTIVVLDRVRENLVAVKPEERFKNFDSIVGNSLSQTFVRSLNTTLTTLLSLVVIYVLTPSSIHNFALALIIGITSGAYSSLFIAAPLLTYFNKEKKEI